MFTSARRVGAAAWPEGEHEGTVTPGHVLFTKLLRCEHRELLETLARLAYALGARDGVAVPVLVTRLIAAAGTHLRYEEASFYPALAELVGAQDGEQMLRNHDALIVHVERLDALLRSGGLTEAQAGAALRDVEGATLCVCACERSSNLVPRLPEEDVARIIAARERAIEEDFNLLHWSGWMRRRRTATPKHEHERDGPWTAQAD